MIDFVIAFFVGLSKRTTTEGLQEAFSKFGEVVHGTFMENCISWVISWGCEHLLMGLCCCSQSGD